MQTTPSVPLRREPTAPDPLQIETTVTLEDRVAAALFSYHDLIAAARRRFLFMLAWLLVVLLAFLVFEARRRAGGGVEATARQFLSDVTGLAGLPVAIVAIPALLYSLLQPALARRRLRRWYRDEKLDQPFVLQCRFEPGGLVSTVAGQSSAIACRRIAGVRETATHAFVQLKDIEDVIALPLQSLSREERDGLRSWSSSCHAGAAAPPAGPELAPSAEPIVTVRFALAEADRTAAVAWQQERPAMRRRRRRALAIALVVAAAAVPLALALWWLVDPDRVPLRFAAPLLAEMIVTDLWKPILGVWAIVGLVAALHPWLRRQHARQLGRQLHKRVQNYENEVRLSADRVDTLQDGLHNRYDWAAIDGIERQGDHVFLRLRQGEPLLLPMRAFDAAGLARFEQIVEEHGAAGGQAREQPA
ncbi:hypothetical protein BN1110_04146 [bacterium YEK0313]|nr:hypothetical protein BN1110_04146 [bacterium YEK0313]